MHNSGRWITSLRRRLVIAWGQLPLPEWLRALILWLFLPKFLVGAVAVIFDENKRVLLFRHTYRTPCAWGLPGGWLKRGEHAHEALEREIYEESGYQIRALRSVVVGGDRRLQRIDLYYECKLLSGTFRPSAEVSEAAFFTLENLPACLEPFHLTVIQYTLSHPERKECLYEETEYPAALH